MVQTVEHDRVAFRILHDHLRLPIHRKDFRGLRFFQPRNVRRVIAQKVGEGVDFAGVG